MLLVETYEVEVFNSINNKEKNIHMLIINTKFTYCEIACKKTSH